MRSGRLPDADALVRPANAFFPAGKVRLAKWFTTMAPKVKAKIVKDVTQLVLARRTRMCNFLEYKGACWQLSMMLMNSVDRLLCRYQGGLQAICIPVLRLRHKHGRQRTGHAGNHP